MAVTVNEKNHQNVPMILPAKQFKGLKYALPTPFGEKDLQKLKLIGRDINTGKNCGL